MREKVLKLIDYISSLQNAKIKDYFKLKNNKQEIIKKGLFITEGSNIIIEALNANIVYELLVTDIDMYSSFEVKKIVVSSEIIKKLSSNISNRGAIAICKYVKQESFDPSIYKKVIVLDNINNPGNLGTIIRTAYGIGFEAVFLLNNSVFPYNDKVIKSTQGLIFNFPVYEIDISKIKNYFTPIYFILNNKAVNIDTVSRPVKPYALVFGNEANGISNELISAWKGTNVFIELNIGVESLNVSSAAAIGMYKIK